MTRLLFLCALLAPVVAAQAESYLVGERDSVVGKIDTTYSDREQTLPDIARLHDLGYGEIKRANPEVDTWIPGDRRRILLPKQFVLPEGPREGIVVNIPEMRLYYFPKAGAGGEKQVYTYPIGIGREGWATPYVTTRVIQKTEKPTWHPPESIREHYAEQGKILPERIPPGPENPLGEFAMRLGLPSYLIHGTNRPYGVGMRVSSGCIRLYPEDIESLFGMVGLDTPVRIVNQPYKVGVLGDMIYLEANPFLVEDTEAFDGNLTSVVKMLVNLSGEDRYVVDWELAKEVIDKREGIPVNIGWIEKAPGQAPQELVTHALDLKLETDLLGIDQLEID